MGLKISSDLNSHSLLRISRLLFNKDGGVEVAFHYFFLIRDDAVVVAQCCVPKKFIPPKKIVTHTNFDSKSLLPGDRIVFLPGGRELRKPTGVYYFAPFEENMR